MQTFSLHLLDTWLRVHFVLHLFGGRRLTVASELPFAHTYRAGAFRFDVFCEHFFCVPLFICTLWTGCEELFQFNVFADVTLAKIVPLVSMVSAFNVDIVYYFTLT